MISKIRSSVRWTTKVAIVLALLISLNGCSLLGAFKPTKVIKHPDASMLITEAKGKYVKVAVYDKVTNTMLDAGWIKLSDCNVGWTLVKFDWNEKIAKRAAEAENDD